MKLFLKLIAAAALLATTFSEGQEKPKAETEQLFTVSFTVPPTFFNSNESESPASRADPFSELAKPKIGSKGFGPKQILERAGVSFPEGASAIYNPAKSVLVVRNTRSQIELVEAYLDSIVADSEKQILVIFEMIEVDHLDFSDWLLSNHMDGDGTVLRKAAQEWVRAGKGTLLHTTTVMARSSQRAKVESVSEHIYPTEYDPPEIPNQVSLSDGATAPVTGVTPTAFETRNLGVTLEVDPVIGTDATIVDLNLAPEFVELAGHTLWATEDIDPLFQTRLPTFYTMKLTTQVTVRHGRYCLLGTTKPREAKTTDLKNPIVLNFVRADIGSVAAWSKEEVKK